MGAVRGGWRRRGVEAMTRQPCVERPYVEDSRLSRSKIGGCETGELPRHLSGLAARRGPGSDAGFGARDSKVPQPAGPEVQHPNGLRLTLPEGYRATRTHLGVVVEPAEGQRRRYEIRVSVLWLFGATPEVRRYQWRRTLAPGRVVRYWSRQTGVELFQQGMFGSLRWPSSHRLLTPGSAFSARQSHVCCTCSGPDLCRSWKTADARS